MRTEPPAIAVHRALLEKWRKAMDLVGPGPAEPHFEDANAAVAELDARGDWADLGSGAGFPGVALAAWHPEAQVALVERREKRAVFLEQVVAQARLGNARVICGDTAALPAASLDGVISRAYRAPAELLDEAARLLRPDGLLVLMLARESTPSDARYAPAFERAYTVDGKARTVVGLRLRA